MEMSKSQRDDSVPSMEIKSEKIVKCIICEKDIQASELLPHFIEEHCSKIEDRTKCNICDKKLVDFKLKNHLKICHGNLEKSHK